MRLEQIQCILEVAKQNSMQKAAEQLHTSIQNVSKLVKQLEDELNIQIFIRNKYGVFLTPDGEYICAQAQKIDEVVHSLQNRYITNTPYPQAEVLPHVNILTAHASSNFSSFLLEKICDKYTPDSAAIFTADAIEINRSLEEDLASLFEKNDFILTNLAQSELTRIRNHFKNIETYFLRKDRLAVRVSDNNELAGESIISIKDIINQPLILALPDANSFSHLQMVIESLGVVLKPKFKVNSPAACNYYIQKNFGYSIVTHDDSIPIIEQNTSGTTIIPLKEQIFVSHIFLLNPAFSNQSLIQYTLSIVKKSFQNMYQLF